MYDWNPFDFHLDFWNQAAHYHCIWNRGASAWCTDDVNCYLMGG